MCLLLSNAKGVKKGLQYWWSLILPFKCMEKEETKKKKKKAEETETEDKKEK